MSNGYLIVLDSSFLVFIPICKHFPPIFRVCVGGSLSECAQWNVMAAPPLGPPLDLARSPARSPGPQLACWNAAVSAGISCYPSAQFRLLLDVSRRVGPFFPFGLHCMSHVALELKTRTRTRCASLALFPFASPSVR